MDNYAEVASDSLDSVAETFSKRRFREKLDENLKTFQNSVSKEELDQSDGMQLRQVLKKKIKMASIYRSLNEGYFEAAEALVFAEINAELPYVSASYITGRCSVLIMDQ